jgi:Arc/MetJ-type ribon-helix-helix transcriptional regulator
MDGKWMHEEIFMSESEKITINMSVVDLGKVDLLVKEGFYTNRTDFIRSAVRRQLDQHAEEVEKAVIRNEVMVGVLIHTREGLEKRLQKGEQLAIRAVGMVVITDDVSPELAAKTIASIRIFGAFKANKAIKAALAERIIS